MCQTRKPRTKRKKPIDFTPTSPPRKKKKSTKDNIPAKKKRKVPIIKEEEFAPTVVVNSHRKRKKQRIKSEKENAIEDDIMDLAIKETKNDEENMIKYLFSAGNIEGAFDHGKLRNVHHTEKKVMDKEAKKAASRALKRLKESERQIQIANQEGFVPTFTGKRGAAGSASFSTFAGGSRPRFGQISRKKDGEKSKRI